MECWKESIRKYRKLVNDLLGILLWWWTLLEGGDIKILHILAILHPQMLWVA